MVTKEARILLQKEITDLEKWVKMGYDAGMWGGFPLGGSYIDSRVNMRKLDKRIKDFVKYDEQMALRYPHLANKGMYSRDIREHIDKIRKQLKR